MRTLFVPLVLLAVLGCDGSSPSQPEGGFEFTTLAEGSVPGSAGPQIQTVVRDEATWARVWNELWAGQPAQRPAVDFSRDMVVLVTGTQVCFGGARVESVEHDGSEIVVKYGDAAASLCLCIQASLAFHAVRTPRLLGDARFESRPTPPLCG